MGACRSRRTRISFRRRSIEAKANGLLLTGRFVGRQIHEYVVRPR
jgi:hypothetical protein